MSKVLKVIAIVAGVVALAASAVATFGASLGIAASLVATAATISTVASVVATAASLGAAALSRPPKPPPAQGSINQVLIGANLPISYCIGRSYSGGNLIYDVGYGGTTNTDRSLVIVHTVAGPIDSLESFQTDYITVATAPGALGGYYSGFMWLDWRNGLLPETALASPSGRAAIPAWGSTAQLSGMAAAMVTMNFDTTGKIFSGGIPQFGVVAKWVKVYDPRLDSTYPGGTGTQRWSDESTWTWSENPGLHALTYARGRFANGKRVVGVGLPQTSIDVPAFVEFANICGANGWKVGGTIYEGPNFSKWDNLKRILASGAADPAWVGGKLTIKVSAPKTSLDDINTADVFGSIEVMAMRSRKERLNTLIPRYRSEAHKWEYVQADAVVQSTYLAEDGETRSQEQQFDLIQSVGQVSQIGAYMLANSRELRVSVTVGPRFMNYYPGEALTIKVPEAGFTSQLAVITSRKINADNGTIELVLESETTAKHSFCLGLTGVAPPTPTIAGVSVMDNIANGNVLTSGSVSSRIATSYETGRTATVTSAGSVTIGSHSRVYADFAVAVTGGSLTLAAGSAGDTAAIYYDDPTRAGGAVTYQSLRVPVNGSIASAITSPTNPYRHFVALLEVPATGTNTAQDSGVSNGPIDALKLIHGPADSGADVTLLVGGSNTVNIPCDYTGVPKASYIPRDALFTLKNGANTDVTTSASWSAVATSGSATFTPTPAAPNTIGDLNVTAMGSNSVVITMSATYNGKTRSGTLTLNKVLDPPPAPASGSTGTTASTTAIAQTTSSAYSGAQTSVLSAKAGAAGQVACTFPDEYYRLVNGTTGAYGKWQWRVVGGTFADITTEIAWSFQAVKNNTLAQNEPGYLDVNMTKTGLTSGTTYEFQLLLRGQVSTGIAHNGTASVVGT